MDQQILELLKTKTYEEVSALTGASRGYIWKLAVRNHARKHEARIQERAIERKRRQREFLAEVMNATVTSDVLDYLDGLPDGAVDLHLTSIPYNVGVQYGGGVSADKWDHLYYLGWMLMVLSEMTRTLREGGVMFLQAGSTRDHRGHLIPLDTILLSHLGNMGLTLRSRVIWTMPHGLTPTGRLAERYETALVLSKGDQRTFNPTSARVPQKDPAKRSYKGPRRGELSGHPLGAFPTNVWSDIPNVGHCHPDKADGGGHPAQFPRALARRAIGLYTVPGDVVADVFVGSGTTACEAKAMGRAFTGCDLFYEDVRARRLARVAPDLVSALPGVTDESIAVWQAEARARNEDAVPITPEQEQRIQEEIAGSQGDLFVEMAA